MFIAIFMLAKALANAYKYNRFNRESVEYVLCVRLLCSPQNYIIYECLVNI